MERKREEAAVGFVNFFGKRPGIYIYNNMYIYIQYKYTEFLQYKDGKGVRDSI